jgi:hypothetical protein
MFGEPCTASGRAKSSGSASAMWTYVRERSSSRTAKGRKIASSLSRRNCGRFLRLHYRMARPLR